MAVHQKSRLHQKFTSGCSGYRTREGSRLTRTLSTKSAIPKSNNDIPSRLYTVAVATSTTRGTYGEGGVNTSPNAPKIKSTPRRQSTTTAIIGGSGMDVTFPWMGFPAVTLWPAELSSTTWEGQ